MTEKKENLEELLHAFLDEQQAAQAERDIRLGDDLLRSYPAPAPDKLVTDRIKAQIGAELAHRRNRPAVLLKRAAVAAVLIAGVLTGIKYMGQNQTAQQPAIAAAGWIWQDNADGGDVQFAMLVNEIEEIEADIAGIRLDEYAEENGADLSELEIEFVEIEGDFWKG